MTFVNGRIEVELAPADVEVDTQDGFPVILPREPMPPLTDELVRDTLDSTRR